ncbi:alpha-mannosidase [Paenibacillus pectinilyticus]|uniref:Alpha-mannosidase n=1 Tax=Paenibacillus pectinilyticus TaxID=512399 RepID=A0A1C0ZXD2_9BACL|nr:alpha-mannosidase [Paenibacillus pectinilyticus]OCT12756.1 alpha-mannosidase [Paenibacillus pectinilyticus]
MSSNKVVHVISHTHWDREWYMPYEAHHVKLIENMDTLLHTFANDPEYRSFYLDGQTIILEDYLQVYPEKRELLCQLSRDGKLSVGPWYVLQDEFLTSSEANVRNLQIGHKDAAAFGSLSKLGYFPDSFGNMGQAAQLLAQAGISSAVFGRGVKATGFNNKVEESSGLESPFSELHWEAPDGSRVLGILFANWYNNGMEIPVDPLLAKPYWEHRLAMAERYASTPHLLLMNGCDHQPVQTDLTAALQVARELFPEYTFIHSSFDAYIKQLQQDVPPDLSVTRGELRGQRTDGWFTLVNTASARIPIKQLNQQNQTLLEKVAEPIAAFAHQLGQPYPHALLQYAWKTLMQNHPHDSICGCSVDEVYPEMKTRFAKSMEVARSLVKERVASIAKQVDTTDFTGLGESAAPFLLFNTSGYAGAGVVTIEVELAQRFFDQSEDPVAIARHVCENSHAEGYLIDANGQPVAHTMEDLGVRFGYQLPNDRFRQPYMARTLRLTFEARELPTMGYATFAWISDRTVSTAARGAQMTSLVTSPSTLENDLLQVSIEADGSYTVLDKRSGQLFERIGIYENTGDIGNEYIFKQPNGDLPITTRGLQADIRIVEDTPYRAAIQITHRLDIPKQADERLAKEIATMVSFRERQAQRSKELATLVIQTTISLDRSGQGVRVRAVIDNPASDHRLRVLFPSGVQAAIHYADSIFEVAERQTVPAPEWENPSHCQHMQTFVDVQEENRGLVIAGKGLNEYEVLQDDLGTIAVTILRAVGELGDWGVFLTPDAQCLGRNEAEWMIIPHTGGADRFEAYRHAYQFPVPHTICQTDVQEGSLPPIHSFLAWEGTGLAFSNLKISEERGDFIARWYNLSRNSTELRILRDSPCPMYHSDILEKHRTEVSGEIIQVGGYKITTIGILA